MNETLSSGLTFFYKYIFIAVWSVCFGFGTVGMFQSNASGAWQFGIAWIGGTFFLWLIAGRLKRVELKDKSLIISNYFRSISVSISDIEEVRQNRLINVRPITISFRQNTAFGRSITFIPPASFRLFSEDPIVERLRHIAKDCGAFAQK